MAKLNTTVHLEDGNGKRHVFAPGQDLPDWAAEKITNPDVWDEEPAGASSHAPPAGGGEQPPPASPPPRSGSGSGRDAWAKYAQDNRVDVADGTSREDIIAALEKAGVPVDVQPKE